MECLVTGAGGFVGREVVRSLAASGHGGLATGRTAPTDLPPGWMARRRDDVLGGPCPQRIDAVIHLEAIHGGPGTTERQLEEVNVEGTRAWLAWAARCGAERFVFVSSMMAAGAVSGPQGEDAPPSVGEGYGASKARAESAVRVWAGGAAGRRAVILRPAPVYGPHARSNFLPFVRRVLAGRPAIVGDGNVSRAVVSRRNLAAAVTFALGIADLGCEVFNVADHPTPTARQLADFVARAADAPSPRSIPRWVALCAAPLGEIASRLTGRAMPLGLSRLRAALTPSDLPCGRLVDAGFRHVETTREAMAEVARWARDTPDAGDAVRPRQPPG